MTDATAGQGGTAVVPAPAATTTSLRGDAAAYKQQIEAMIGNPGSAYWRGTPDRAAALIQADYADLLRAEHLGASMPVGPRHEGVDPDLPANVGKYDISDLPIHSASDRDLVDLALADFHSYGFGQARTRDVLRWAMSQSGPPTERAFREWAVSRRWTDRHVNDAIAVYRGLKRRNNR